MKCIENTSITVIIPIPNTEKRNWNQTGDGGKPTLNNGKGYIMNPTGKDT